MSATANLLRRLVESIADHGRALLDGFSHVPLEQLCDELVSERGEAAGTAIAQEILRRYATFTGEQRLRFFESLLAKKWLAPPDQILTLAQAYHANPNATELAALVSAVEPRRQDFFRRLNMGPRGTESIVKMREDLLLLLPERPQLEPVNGDLVHLLSSWFNRGFLEIRRIDWRTPALILEKLIKYESVHEIRGWPDLRRRLERDRRCFAFFHAALPDDPLIFVEVALTKGAARAIQPLIDLDNPPSDPAAADTAVFYSINNCLEGLRNISFGAFLIKQVVQELQAEGLDLKHFVTLSPSPRFNEWLKTQPGTRPISKTALMKFTERDATRKMLLRECVQYLTARREDGRALDPVAAFHLNNGASIERINWLGDVSEKGLKQAYGLMVNYAYRPARIERNHEQYVKQGRAAMSEDVRSLLGDVNAKG